MKKEREEYVFRVYLAEALRMTSENTARINGGAYVSIKFDDIINPPKSAPEDPRSCYEIAQEIFARAKGGD